MIIILVGPPFAGKTLITQLLCRKYDYQPLNVGQDDADVSIVSIKELDKFVLSDKVWSKNWVLDYNLTLVELEKLRKRPFVLILAVWAALGLRHVRSDPHEFDDEIMFMEHEDIAMMDENGLAKSLMADMTLINDCTIDVLESRLGPILDNAKEILRPSWDSYFIQLCQLASKRSNCMKRRVGCVLTKDRRVVSTGYNGTASAHLNCNQGGCARCNGGNSRAGTHLDVCLCLHAEENALLEAGRAAACASVLYCTTFPCLGCAKSIAQVGVAEVVYESPYSQDIDQGDALRVMKNAGILVRQHTLLTKYFATKFPNILPANSNTQ